MVSFTRLSILQFSDRLSRPEAVPGGGSAAALVGLTACSLTQMVGGIFLKRVREASRRRRIQQLLTALKREALKIGAIIDEDPRVFERLMRAYRIRGKGKGRERRIDEGLSEAFEVQRRLASLLIELCRINRNLKGEVDGSIRNDLLLSEAFARAAFQGAFLTARINWKYTKDPKRRAKMQKALKTLRREFASA